jgi:hypothetical protein
LAAVPGVACSKLEAHGSALLHYDVHQFFRHDDYFHDLLAGDCGSYFFVG